jgi:prefoldin subunit 5
MPWNAAAGPPFDAEAERQVLTSQAEALRAQLRAVESRIEGYEKKEKPE